MTLDIVTVSSAPELAADVAARLVATIVSVQADGGIARIVLTGGRIAEQILTQVSASAADIDWTRIHLWWGDERYVASGDTQRNDVVADRELLARVSIPDAHVHRVAGAEQCESAEIAAERYSADLLATLAEQGVDGQPWFDVVMLSVGPDGHVASLFPEHPALIDTAIALAVHNSPKPPPTRVTMSFPTLSRGQQVWLLASGREKAAAVRMLLSRAGYLQIPAAGVRGVTSTLLLCDAEAAREIPEGLARPGV